MSGDVAAHLVVERPDGFTLDVNLHLPAGATTALVGPNGAGKSTVVEALAGLLAIDGGRIELGGRVVDDASTDTFVPARHRDVGVVFQHGLLFAHLTVVDNVAFGPRSRGARNAQARSVAMGWLERLGVAHLAGRLPEALSGGQAQRVALARALATDPSLLLLDEPLSALDVQGRGALRRLLADQLAALDGPRLLVSHDPIEAFLLADWVAIIEAGRLTQTGTPDDIRRRPRTAYAAELAGTNLLRGRAADGAVTIGGHTIQVADTTVTGPVLAVIHPHAVVVSLEAPVGSARNAWPALVTRIESFGQRVRISVEAPVPLTAEVTPGAVADLDVTVGSRVWLSIKATEVSLTRDA